MTFLCSTLTYSIGLKVTCHFLWQSAEPKVWISRSKRQEIASFDDTIQGTFHVVLCLLYTYCIWDLNSCLTERIKSARCLFNSAGSMFCAPRSSLFSFLKCFQQFHISFRFLFRVHVFETFHVILDRSIAINKPFLVNVFKLRHLRRLKISLKSEILPAEWKSPCYGSHVKKHDTRHLIGSIVFLTRKKRYAPFDWLLGS